MTAVGVGTTKDGKPFTGIATGPAIKEPFACGFCNTGNHDRCPVKVRGATRSTSDGMWSCACPVCADKQNHPFCLLCKHRSEVEGEIGPRSWTCMDRDACTARREAKLAANPVIQNIRALQEKRMTETATEKVEKAPKAPKVGNCLHCGDQTKGGKFLPGHDAAFVSDQVGFVMAASNAKEAAAAEKKARAAMEDTSPALQKKFERSLELAKEKVEKAAKRAEEKAASDARKAEEKAAAKAAKEAAKAEEKAKESTDEDVAPEDVEDADDNDTV